MKKRKTRQVGQVCVDTGQVVIVDPCLLAKQGNEKELFEECCFRTLAKKGAGPVFNRMAVVSETGYGDGFYPVFATYDEHGRVAELKIEFIRAEDQSSS